MRSAEGEVVAFDDRCCHQETVDAAEAQRIGLISGIVEQTGWDALVSATEARWRRRKHSASTTA